MGFINNKFFVLIILVLLQSCSGGRIGNFFESSFKDIEEEKIKGDIKNNLKNKVVIKSGRIKEKNKNIEEKKIKEDIKNNLKNKIVINSGGVEEKNKNVEETKIKNDINNLKNRVLKKSEEKTKNNKKITDKSKSFRNRKYQPQSYKVIFILKDVDPKDPTEDIRTILRNSDVNFEIEKIERYFDPKNKSIKNN